MVLCTITLLASALVVTLGTSAPILTRFLENPGQVGPAFYNRVNLPLALLTAFLVALVPFLTWRGAASWGELLGKARWGLVAAAAVAVLAAILGVRSVPLLLVLVAARR